MSKQLNSIASLARGWISYQSLRLDLHKSLPFMVAITICAASPFSLLSVDGNFGVATVA